MDVPGEGAELAEKGGNGGKKKGGTV